MTDQHDPTLIPQRPQPVTEAVDVDEEELEEKGGARRRFSSNSRQKNRNRLPSLPILRLRPFRTIVILIIIILILLFLILHFGLGSGGGKVLPGSGATKDPATYDKAPVETEVEAEKPAVRRELSVSFFPSPTDPDSARELACNLDWIDQTTESQESRRIATENMIDFEFELEKAIRAWRTALGTGETQDIPVVSVSMTPFPGEGVFRKIESIAHRIDPRISILRLESAVKTADEK